MNAGALLLAAAVLFAAPQARAAGWKRQLSFEQRLSGGAPRVHDTELGYGERFSLSDAFTASAGAGYARAELSGGGPLLPNRLQAASARLGGEWILSPRWWVLAGAAPGLYGADILGQDDFNAPAHAAVHFLKEPGLRFALGLVVDTWSETPVLPFGGVVWRVDERWNLNLMPPKLRVEYRALDGARGRLELFTGVSFRGTSVRVRSDRLSRREIASETGAAFERRGLRAELSGGWSFSRRYKYRDSGVEVDAGGAAFAALALSARL